MGAPNRRWLQRTFSVLLILSLPFPVVAATGPKIGKGPATSVSWKESRALSGAQVDSALSVELAGGGFSTFLVTLRDQADVNTAGKAASQSAKSAAKTPRAQRLASANAVVQSLKDVASKSQQNLLGALKGLKADGSVTDYQPFWITNVIAVTGDMKALEAMKASPEVSKIQPSRTFHVMGAPGLQSGGAPAAAPSGGSAQSVEWNIQAINAPAAWGLGYDGTGSVVASLDTGVDGTHPALARKWRGADGSNPAFSWFDAVNGRNTAPYDDHGHGTHTTGTMVGSDLDGTNQVGVAPGAQWIAAKILNSAGSGSDVNIITAGQWILAPGGDAAMAPDVVSNSWGGGPGLDEWFRPVVSAWRAAGIVPVFAAGNDGPGSATVANPGNYPEAVTVGATDSSSNLASFSSRGPSPYNEIKPEVSAPGVGIRSSVPGGGYQGGWSGTSMATPHVSGTVALLRQVNASLTPDDIELILKQSATPRTDATYTSVPNNGYGYGIINAFDAVSAASVGLGTLSGRVLVGGDDLDPPVITHTPIVGPVFAGTDVTVSAQVTDNVSVTDVTLFAKKGSDPYYTAIPMTNSAGDYKNGTWSGAVPWQLVQMPSISYYLRATDFGNNPVQTAPVTLTVLAGLTPGWSTDLETQPTGWEHGGTQDSWQWGAPTSGPGAAHSGQNLWATNLSGDYANGMNAYLALPPLDLTGSTGARLTFNHWYDFESGFDFAEVWVIDQNNVETMVTSFTGASGGWKQGSVNLTPWAGQRIFVLFNARSDSSVTKAGWYVDDLSLMGADTTAPAAPTGLTATAATDGSVALAWTANAEPDLANYRIYRTTTSGLGYTQLGTSSTPGYTDSSAPTGTTLYYVVTAMDFWGNQSAGSAEASATTAGETVLFFDDFELGAPGWTHSGAGDTWALGAPTSGPGSAASGTNVWATNLSGTYLPSANASLVSPPITLSATSPSLRFAQWYEFENNWDFGYVEISTNDGATWTLLGTRLTGTSGAWLRSSVDLTAYATQTVRIRFRQTSDSTVNRAGWYIDDVKVAAAAAPTNLGPVSPSAKKAEKIEPTLLFHAKKQAASTGAIAPAAKPGAEAIGIMALPVSATVTILQTGRSTRTNPANGQYSMRHAAGAYTAVAEAYGYYPNSQAVTLTLNGSTLKNFVLQPIPKGTIQGVVTDARTGAPLPGATVEVMEDGHIAPVTTGAAGDFTMEVYEGTYTVKVALADYKGGQATATVTGGHATNLTVALEPFIGYNASLAYDDGTAENAWAYRDTGNGWAVRMSPDPAKGTAMLTEAGFYIWNNTWPVPGGTTYAVAIYDASGTDGAPGNRVAGPIVQTATRGAWNTVNLRSLGLSFTGDFYVAYIQQGANPNVPGLGTDESSGSKGHSWQFVGGSWSPVAVADGNFMIRSNVQYEVGIPTITSPATASFTNQAAATVEGTAIDGVTVNLYRSGVAAGTGTATGGHFAIPVTLQPGSNSYTATASVGGRETRASAPVVINLDQTNPVITITKPTDGSLTNKEVATIAGSVAEANLASVSVNGQVVPATGGNFSTQMILADGPNVITVVATDKAGNQGTKMVTVTRMGTPPVLSAIMPNTNVTLPTGQSVVISFDSTPGLPKAGYRIVLAGATGIGSKSDPVNMTETTPGHYQGTYTAPAGTAFAGAQIQVWAEDAATNRATETAAGLLTLTGSTNRAPIARITPPTNPRKARDLQFSGSTSSDPDGRISSYRWNWGDGSRESTGVAPKHRYANAGTYTVTLTVTDNKGATGMTTYTIVVAN